MSENLTLPWPEWLVRAAAALSAAGIDDTPGKLRYVASVLLRCSPGQLDRVAASAPPPPAPLAARREEALGRLLAGEPAQYVVGETDFLDFTLATDARALIPRPETEEWVDALIRHLTGRPQLSPSYRAVEPWPPLRAAAPLRIHDVCTGTGCIAIALARALPPPRAIVTASDLSPAALALAGANAAALAAPVDFACADLLAGIPDASLDLLTANPPYIASAACDRLAPTVRLHEPRLALDGGPDGLALISRLAAEAPRVLKPNAELWLEIGDDQAAPVESLLCHSLFPTIQILSDFAGRARLVRALRR